MKISEIFYSVQGEIDIGKPAVFVRLAGCNMIPKCEWCDSCYTWNNKEEFKEMTPQEVYDEIKEYNCSNIIFTGGEPTLQIEEIEQIIDMFEEETETYWYDIETNGLNCPKELYMIDRINCSPKKQNINIEILKKINDECSSRFKFVYESKDDLWFEDVIEKIGIESGCIYIMPEGQTKVEQESKMNEVIEYCKEKGYNFSPRLHVLVWGDERAK